MLCGLYPPTSGTASIMGFDLRHEIDEIHSIIGYCPQHDILYDSLNVEEHLILVAKVNELFFVMIQQQKIDLKNLCEIFFLIFN